MRRAVVVLMLAVLQSSVAQAQTCPPAAPNNAPAWLQFEVDTPAQFIRTGAVIPFPDHALDQRQPFPKDFALIQFIVDTTGVPIARSLKILLPPEGLIADSVSAALLTWRFQPAIARGCKVPQLWQSALRWK